MQSSELAFNKEHLEKVKEGVRLYNQQKYWECHEELEHHWLEDRGDNVRLVYWAIIQVAAALFHYREGNLTGAQGMLNKAKDKFRRAEQAYVESTLLEKSLNWSQFKKLVREVPDEAKIEDFNKLYRFKFPERGTL